MIRALIRLIRGPPTYSPGFYVFSLLVKNIRNTMYGVHANMIGVMPAILVVMNDYSCLVSVSDAR